MDGNTIHIHLSDNETSASSADVASRGQTIRLPFGTQDTLTVTFGGF